MFNKICFFCLDNRYTLYREKSSRYILGEDLCLKRKKFEICFWMKKK